MAIARILLVSSCLLVAVPALADWSDLVGIKSKEATDKVQNRAGQEVDEAVDDTVNCVFNPIECARKMQRNDSAEKKPTTPEKSSESAASGPPRPPSASRPKAGPPPPPSARTWHVDVGGGSTQEVDEKELISMIGRGEIDRSTPVWTESFGGEFKDAGNVSQLQRHFK